MIQTPHPEPLTGWLGLVRAVAGLGSNYIRGFGTPLYMSDGRVSTFVDFVFEYMYTAI